MLVGAGIYFGLRLCKNIYTSVYGLGMALANVGCDVANIGLWWCRYWFHAMIIYREMTQHTNGIF
jgi:hypothetical protein